MITKTQVINAISSLPENLTIDQLIDRLMLVEKVQRGLIESENNHILSKELAKEKLNKWLK